MFKIREGFYNNFEDGINIIDLFDLEAKTTNKKITYYNDVVTFDIETSSFKDIDEDAYFYQDSDVYNHLKGVKIRINDKYYKEFPDFNIIRRDLFGRIYFSKNDGIAVDSLYQELSGLYPYYFSEDIINPYDQLRIIIQVFNDNAPEKIEHDNKRALMYVWGFSVNGTCIIGRTWEQFIKLLNDISQRLGLNDQKRIIIWCHNLSMEFQFMKDYFTWKKVFAISTRKPIYALTDNGIEFRCSYILSNLSLANVGKSLKKYKVSKLVGDLDYEKIRHSETPLTNKEINYLINDNLVLAAYIKEQIEDAGNSIIRLPLTSTGYCRNYTRQNCLGHKDSIQYRKYRKIIERLIIADMDEYKQMQRAFAGGFTHCSTRHSMKTLCTVSSFDLCSAYPAALCLFKEFPMSKGKIVDIDSIDTMKKYLKLYFCLFDIKFYNLVPIITNENYISASKCFALKNAVTNNGRVVGASELSITITNIDFDIIKRFYKWDKLEIGIFRIYKRDYLPREVIISILNLFKNKTTLKGVSGMEDFYTKNKQLLNSIYGMMVTSVIMPFHNYDNITGWTITQRDAEKELKIYNNSKKRFLYFPWGIACTALTRRTVTSAILAFGDDYIYSDTDSIKCLNPDKHIDYIERYNKYIRQQIEKVSKHYNIPIDMFMPKTVKGVTKTLGVWENETPTPWKQFKSLGAKRYMILTHENELTITVSGVNKKFAAPYLDQKYGKAGAFTAFTNDLEIPADYTGKLTHFYLDSEYTGQVCDYLGNTIKYKCKSGIYFEKASYNFSMESAYLSYLRELRGEIIA